MMESNRERHAQDAINQFVQYSCVFILPGAEGHIATEVGSGIIISTKKNHYAVLTAKHFAKSAKAEEYRLGYYKCSNPIPNFVAGILLFPNDVDVALLILKDELSHPFKKFSITSESIPTRDFDIQEKDILILNGFPGEVSYYSKERSEQGFLLITHWCFLSSKSLDDKGRYRVEWKDAANWCSDVDFELPSPEGMSGGPLWRFRKPPDNYIWSPSEIGKIIGIQSAWIGNKTLLIEPVHKWASWFHESLEKIDEFCG